MMTDTDLEFTPELEIFELYLSECEKQFIIHCDDGFLDDVISVDALIFKELIQDRIDLKICNYANLELYLIGRSRLVSEVLKYMQDNEKDILMRTIYLGTGN